MEKKHSPIKSQEIFYKIKNGYYPIFPLLVPKGDLWGVKGDQRNMNIP
jgi:hypothetical protein